MKKFYWECYKNNNLVSKSKYMFTEKENCFYDMMDIIMPIVDLEMSKLDASMVFSKPSEDTVCITIEPDTVYTMTIKSTQQNDNFYL